MEPETTSLIVSSVLAVAAIIYIRHVVRTSGKERVVDPAAVDEFMRTVDWSLLDDSTYSRKKSSHSS